MKRIFFFITLIIQMSCGESINPNDPLIFDKTQVVGTPIIIDYIEIAQNDFPKLMNWDEALEGIKILGEEWRLPTPEELELMNLNREKIGGFEALLYWSANSLGSLNGIETKVAYGFWDGATTERKYVSLRLRVRAVKNHRKYSLKPKLVTPKTYHDDNEIVGIPIKIENFEVAQYDFNKEMKWHDAIKACEKLGEGWRLPNKDELNILYQNKNKIGNFENRSYWSCTSVEGNTSNEGTNEYKRSFAWARFFDGKEGEFVTTLKIYTHSVRAIRNL
jgi:hypothetical protein